MTRFLRFLDRLPNWLRAGVMTGLVVTVPTFGFALLDWIEGFFAWLAGEPVELPSFSVVRSAAVGVVSGAIYGAINAVIRRWQEWRGTGNPPVYPSRVGGDHLRGG